MAVSYPLTSDTKENDVKRSYDAYQKWKHALVTSQLEKIGAQFSVEPLVTFENRSFLIITLAGSSSAWHLLCHAGRNRPN